MRFMKIWAATVGVLAGVTLSMLGLARIVMWCGQYGPIVAGILTVLAVTFIIATFIYEASR